MSYPVSAIDDPKRKRPIVPHLPPALLNQAPAHQVIQRTQHDPSRLTPNDVMALQRTMGNTAVQRLLDNGVQPPSSQPPRSQQRAAAPPASTIQAKLAVGPANDRYEQEADQVAHQVIHNLHPSKSISASYARSAKQPQDEQRELTPQHVTDIRRAQAGGNPLASPVRSAMEQAFGANFGGVRIHQSPRADTLSRSINARAFTHGQDIFFRQGEYQQNSVAGQGLLAHELTHVVQQRGAQVQRQETPEERLPSAQQSAVSGTMLGQQPQIVQRSQPGRIHRCGGKDKKKQGTTKSKNTKKTTSTPISANTGPKSSAHTGPSSTTHTVPMSTSSMFTDEMMPISYGDSTGVDDLSTLSKDQTEAIEMLEKSGIDPVDIARATILIQVPDAIDQTAHGVCGLVAILRAVVKTSPKRFAEMVIAAMSDTKLIEQWLPVFEANASTEQQNKHAELEFITSQWLVRKSAKGDVSQKVLNNKGGVTTKTKDYSQVYQSQVDFSNSFGITGWEHDLGHFAMTTGGLNYLLNSVGSGRESFKIKVTNFKEDYQIAKAKAGKNGSVLASVTNTEFYEQKGKAVDTVQPKAGPKYVHWVMIDDVKEVGDYFVLKLWTWAGHYFARVREDVIASHIPSLIAAETDGI